MLRLITLTAVALLLFTYGAAAAEIKPYGTLNYKYSHDENSSGVAYDKLENNGSKIGIDIIEPSIEGSSLNGIAKLEVGLDVDDSGSDTFDSRLAYAGLENNGIAKIEGYRNYLETTNYSEELKKCLILRNTLMSSLVIDQEVKRLFNLYIPTPVPAIWLFRLILIQIIENIVGQYATYEVLEKGLKQCGDFENLWPSEQYLDLTFEEKN